MKKVCIVGCGGIAKVHVKNLLGKVELSFVSRRRESAESFSKEFGGGTVFESYEQVLGSDVHGVVICTPPGLHVEQVVAALGAGKGVMVEKPMCVTGEEVEAIGQAVAKNENVPLLVAENYYYKPSLKKIQWIIEQGFVGEVREVQLRKCFSQAAAGWKSSYGALLEGGIHFVALLSGIVNKAPEQVQAEFPGYDGTAPERHSITQLEYADGLRAKLHYAWNVFSPTKGVLQHSHIRGDQGHITFESNGIYVRLKSKRHSQLYFPGFADMMGYGEMTCDFIDCLNEPGRKPLSGFTEAQRDLNIVFQAYKGL